MANDASFCDDGACMRALERESAGVPMRACFAQALLLLSFNLSVAVVDAETSVSRGPMKSDIPVATMREWVVLYSVVPTGCPTGLEHVPPPRDRSPQGPRDHRLCAPITS